MDDSTYLTELKLAYRAGEIRTDNLVTEFDRLDASIPYGMILYSHESQQVDGGP